MRGAKSAKTGLSLGIGVRIADVEWRTNTAAERIAGGGCHEDQHRLEVGLVQHVHMDPLSEIAAVADVTAGGIKLLRNRRREPALNVQPLWIRSQVIDAGNLRPHAVINEI